MKFVVSMQDKASAAAKNLLKTMQGFNTTVVTRVNLALNSTALGKLRSALQAIKSEAGGISLDILNKPLDFISKKLQSMKGALADALKPPDDKSFVGWANKLSGIFKKLGGAVLGIEAGFAAAGVAIAAIAGIYMKKWVDQSIELNSNMETYQIQLQTTLGSLTAAKKEMAGIVDFAKQTPFEIKEITDAVVKLSAYNMDTKKWLEPLGDMAAAFGRPITDAVEAAADAAMGQFRRSLSYGIKMERLDFKDGGKYAGMDYADAFMMEVQKRFSGGMALQAQSFKGVLANIKDVMSMGLVEMGKPIFDKAKETINKVYELMQSDKATAAIKAVTETVRDGVNAFSDSIGPVVTLFITTILPTVAEIGMNLIKVFMNFADILSGPIFKAFTTILIPVMKIVMVVTDIASKTKLLTAILLGVGAAIGIFKLLSIGVLEAATSMTQLGKTGSILAASMNMVGKRVLGVVATLGVLNMLSNGMTVKDRIREIGNEIKTVDGSIKNSEVPKYLSDLASKSGRSVTELSEAAIAAKEFGTNSQVVLEVAATSAEELGMKSVEAAETIGTLAANFVELGDSTEQARQKTLEVAAALIYVQQNEKQLGLDTEEVLSVFKDYPEVMSKIKGGLAGVVNLMSSAASQGVELRKVMEAVSMLLTPDDFMLRSLPADTWIGMTTDEMQDMGAVMDRLSKTEMGEDISADFGEMAKRVRTSGEVIEDTLENYAKLTKESTSITEEFAIKTSYSIEDILNVYRMMYRDLENLKEAQESWNSELDKNNDIIDTNKMELAELAIQLTIVNNELEMLSSLEPTGLRAHEDAVFELEQAIDGLKLQQTYNDLEQLTGGFAAQEREINDLTSAIKGAKNSLEPLKDQLEDVEDQFKEISDAISDAQNKLDKFTEPKLEGMGDFDDKLQAIDSQLNKLKRQRMDMKNPLEGLAGDNSAIKDSNIYKQYQVQIDAVDKQIAALESTREKTELDRKIAYDDQLYQLGKIGDMEKEITFEEALAGATAARSEIEKLTPQLEEIEKRKNAISDIIDQKQQEIDKQKELLESKQNELDAAKAIRDTANEELQYQIDKLEATKEIAELEWSINNARLTRAKEQVLNPVTEGLSMDSIGRMSELQGQKTGIEAKQGALNLENSQLELQNDKINVELSRIQGEISQIESYMSTIEKKFPDMIEEVNAERMVGLEREMLENLFGPDIAKSINSMNANIAAIASKEGINANVAGAEEGEKRGIIGKAEDFLMEHSTLNTIVSVAGGIAATVLGGKVIKAGAKGVQTLASKSLTSGKGVVGKAETLLNKKAGDEITKTSKKVMENLKVSYDKALKAKDIAGQNQVLKAMRDVKGAVKSGDLKGLKQIESNLSGIGEAAQKAAKKTGKLTVKGGILGGIVAAKPAKEAVNALQNLFTGKGGKITNTRTFMYNAGEALGPVQAAKKGTLASNIGSRFTGQQISKRVMGPLRNFLGGGGKNPIIAKGKGMLPLLAISGLMGMGEGGLGGAAEAAAQMGSYMGVTKGGEKIVSKLIGKGAGKAIPILGTIGLLGDLAGMLEGALGKDLGSVAGDATQKAAGWLGFKDGGEGLGEATGQAVNGAVDTAQNISGVLDGLAGGLVGLGKGIFTGDWSYLKDSMSSLWENLKMIPENILKALGGVGKSVMEIGEELFAKITWPFQKAWEWLVDNFPLAAWIDEKIVQPVIGFFSGIWAGIKDFLSDPFNNFKEFLFAEDGIKSWPGKIIEWFMGIPDWLGTVWASISGALSGPFSSAWEWISTNVSTWFGSVVGWLKGIPEWFGDTWDSITEKVKAPFEAAWEWISDPQNGIASWPGKILGWIKSIPTKIGEAWGFLKDAGSKIVEAIKEGLSEAWETIKDLPGIGEVISVIQAAAGAVGGVLGKVGDVLGFAEGGISTGPTSGHLELLHGTEAIIPLSNGSVPVKLLGSNVAGPKSITYNTDVNIAAGAFIVRDDEDIEDIKKAILSLREAQGAFMDSPRFYSGRY